MHLVHQCSNFAIPSRKVTSWASRCTSTAWMTSLWNWWPRKWDFSFRNRQKSDGASSGELGALGNSSKPHLPLPPVLCGRLHCPTAKARQLEAYLSFFLWLLRSFVAILMHSGSCSVLSLSRLKSATHFFTVEEQGESSPSVLPISTWISLGHSFLCRYLITALAFFLSTHPVSFTDIQGASKEMMTNIYEGLFCGQWYKAL